MNLGKAIKHARMTQGMTQKDLSKQSGVSASYLSLLEKNKRNPSMSTFLKIAGTLKISSFLLIFSAELRDSKIEDIIGMELAEKLVHEYYRQLR